MTERIHDSDTFCRMVIRSADSVVLIDLAVNAPPDLPASATPAGPTLAPEELAGNKLLALSDRAAARDLGLISVNQGRYPELPRAPRPRPQVWTPALTGWRPAVGVWTAAQTAQFLAQVRGHRLYALFHLVALRGLRRGEAAGLRWSDLELDAGTPTVTGQLQQLGGRLVAGPPKSDAGRRVIALDKTTITALREHRLRQQAERAAAGTRWAETGYAFTTVTGTPFRPDRMTRPFAKLVAASGLPPVTLHGLRHGAATLALAAGADLKVVQDQLGHSTITLTADTDPACCRKPPAPPPTTPPRSCSPPARLPAGDLRQGAHPGDFQHGHERTTASTATPPDCTASPPCCGHRRAIRRYARPASCLWFVSRRHRTGRSEPDSRRSSRRPSDFL
jgi:integrase